jgi:hypothetical protein
LITPAGADVKARESPNSARSGSRRRFKEGLKGLRLKRAVSSASQIVTNPRARWRELEGYLSVALAALLFATPTLARWLGVWSTVIGVPVFYSILVFGFRGIRSRGGGRFAAYLALTLVVAAMIAMLVIVTLEFPAVFSDHKYPSR